MEFHFTQLWVNCYFWAQTVHEVVLRATRLRRRRKFNYCFARNYCYARRWKNFKNRSAFGKVRGKSRLAPFFRTRCTCKHEWPNSWNFRVLYWFTCSSAYKSRQSTPTMWHYMHSGKIQAVSLSDCVGLSPTRYEQYKGVYAIAPSARWASDWLLYRPTCMNVYAAIRPACRQVTEWLGLHASCNISLIPNKTYVCL